IMRSDAGTGVKQINVGFAAEGGDVSGFANLSDYFKPEFLNRFDGIIQFSELSQEDLVKIVDSMLQTLERTIENNQISIRVSDEAKEQLVKIGYEPRFGARPLRRVIQDKIENQLTDLILEEDDVRQVDVIVEDNEIKVVNAAAELA